MGLLLEQNSVCEPYVAEQAKTIHAIAADCAHLNSGDNHEIKYPAGALEQYGTVYVHQWCSRSVQVLVCSSAVSREKGSIRVYPIPTSSPAHRSIRAGGAGRERLREVHELRHP